MSAKSRFRCRRYQVKLVPGRDRMGVRMFQEADGKKHTCFKLKHGQWVKCRYLEVS